MRAPVADAAQPISSEALTLNHLAACSADILARIEAHWSSDAREGDVNHLVHELLTKCFSACIAVLPSHLR